MFENPFVQLFLLCVCILIWVWIIMDAGIFYLTKVRGTKNNGWIKITIFLILSICFAGILYISTITGEILDKFETNTDNKTTVSVRVVE